MIFRFIVAHCRSLARVPFMPRLFDAMLLAWTVLTDRRKLGAIELLEAEARRVFATTARPHRFGGTEFCLAGCELGHVHGNGLFDANIGPANRTRAVTSGLAEPHHVFPRSGWVSLWMKSERDVARAVELMRFAADFRRSTARHASPPPAEIE